MAKNSKQYSFPILVDIQTKGGAELSGLLQGAIKAGSTLTNNINKVLEEGASKWSQTLIDIVTRSMSDTGLKNTAKGLLTEIQKSINDTKLTLITSDTVQDAKDKVKEIEKQIEKLKKEQSELQSEDWGTFTYKRKGRKDKSGSNMVGMEYLQEKFNAAKNNSTILQPYDVKDLTNLEKAQEILKALSDETVIYTQNEKKLKVAIESRIAELNKRTEDNINIQNKSGEITAHEQEINSINAQIEEYEKNQSAYDEYATWLAGVTAYITQLKNGNPIALLKPPTEAGDVAKDVASDTQAKLDKLNDDYNETKQSAEQLTQALGQQYISFQAIKRAMMEVYNVTKQLDTAFNEIAVVSTYSTKEVWNMYDSFLEIANATGTTSTEIIQVAGEYFKQGKSLSESLVLTEAAAMAAKVAGISATESVSYLTAALNGYNLAASEAMNVSDKFSKLAAISATDYEDLAIALGKVAAQANASGVNMDSLMGFMTTALEVTQEAPENIGTALTLSA